MNKQQLDHGSYAHWMLIILFGAAGWLLLFGVTVDGRHYDLSCTCSRGLAIDGSAMERSAER